MLNAEMLHIYYCQFLLLAFLKNRKLKCHNRRLHSSANIEFYNLIVYFGHFVAVANWIKRIGLYANCARLPRGAYNLFANRSPRQTCKLVCGENGNVNGTGERTDFDLVSRCRNWNHTALFTFHLTQSLHKLHRFEETPVCCRRNIRYIARALPYIFAENQHVNWSREFINECAATAAISVYFVFKLLFWIAHCLPSIRAISHSAKLQIIRCFLPTKIKV